MLYLQCVFPLLGFAALFSCCFFRKPLLNNSSYFVTKVIQSKCQWWPFKFNTSKGRVGGFTFLAWLVSLSFVQPWVIDPVWHFSLIWTDTTIWQTVRFLVSRGACGITASFPVFTFSPSFQLVIWELFAAQRIASGLITRTLRRS